ncbi:SDR family NAD(P)-dependent oxidoreductase [Ilyobacter polytropus]|uniref:Short-chain dehydrogenase/reductase SDR n=1 Tax=Ilyobacter polytropus (strain ATCC 51220 / DSM 2926 / LMG 16218 / CuHBu1) TaxID=572544 RepID=E3H8D3_ILYPC|nr:SDR family oxidoreductase [Ilyobacter polytropus]ADO82700.1 short-chain dehydrogenase/reductase SDR [Ilyobacter polytropus DSM 2926]
MIKNALITGATSGIGAAFARQLGEKGYNLYITGRRREIIEKLAQEIREKHNVAVEVIIADFTNESEIDCLLEKITSVDIEFLVNNVGFGHEKKFLDDSYENQRKMIEAHIESFCKITHLVAGKMKKTKKGQIINVSSLAAFTPAAFNHLYSSTKSFIITFSEALYIELYPLGINVQVLCPGFTKSDFHRSLKIQEKTFENRGLIRWMTSEEVVRLSLNSVDKRGGIFIPGWSNKILYTIIKALPRKLYYVMARYMKM